ncbi:MAG: hypothetical protein ACK4RK_19700 [Gemmataceae bacterium]
MSIEKQATVKEPFWFILGGCVFVVLIGLIWLLTSVSFALDAQRKKVSKVQADLRAKESVQETKKEFESLSEKARRLEARREEVWKDAWNIQSDLMTWPGELQQHLGDAYFGDPIAEASWRDVYMNLYRQQYSDLADLVSPVLFKAPPAQDGSSIPDRKENWPAVLQWVRQWRPEFGPPTAEDMWLAQEDYWVQRELLKAIKEANDRVAQYELAEGAGMANTVQREYARQRFVNPYWQIDLVLADSGPRRVLKGKIKNLSPMRQLLTRVSYQVWFEDPQTARPSEEFTIQSEPIDANQEADLNFMIKDAEGERLSVELPITNQSATRLLGLAQVLDPATAPIKRIDRIEIGQHAHRTYDRRLYPAKQFGRVDIVMPSAQPTSADPMAGGGNSAVPAPTSSLRASNKTPHGLERLRYMLEPSHQCRQLPFGMVLLVDQAHVQDVLTALSNSKLRIQTTQVEWQRYRGQFKPPTTAKPIAQPMDTFSDPTKTTPRKPEEPKYALVQLAFYGVASLYERYPPRATTPTTTSENPMPEN